MSVAAAVLISAEITANVVTCHQSGKLRWVRLLSNFAEIEG